MFIQIENTPDPATLKFLPGREVLGSGEVSYGDRSEAALSPLALRLFDIATVRRVTLGADYIAVTRDGDADWQVLKPPLLGIIMEHFITGRAVFEPPALAADYDPADEPLVAALRALIDDRIRPGVEAEGGRLAFRGYRDRVVELELGGSGLAAPLFSLEVRIENTLRHEFPEIGEVRFSAPARAAPPASLDRDDPEVAGIHRLLEDEINPAVAAHGGHIALLGVDDHIAYIRLEGGCQGCGLADVTLKQGVEVAIMQAVPTIAAVRDTTDHAGGSNPYYQPDKGGASPF
ncbi:MAG: NifU family protein [Alphaproteobacteria bacterium]